jgi:hypothetical protein
MNSYGQTMSDKLAEENNQARKIILEINNFGITERQRWLIMYYLALELEDVEKMQELTSILKEMNPNINMTHVYEGTK